ncbi:MAG: hypothetical protein IT249_07595 [Chitinophagaceae bacterium]|nr:hypothetical protein [Chitinophagaceae bacterium]
MKKWFVIVIVLIVVAITLVYVIIPSSVSFRSSVSIKTTNSALSRLLQDKNSICKWWPGSIDSSGIEKKFSLNNRNYKIVVNNISLLPVIIETNGSKLNSALYMISSQPGNVVLEWVINTPASKHIFSRITQYLQAKNLKQDMQKILENIHRYFSDEKNIYGFNIAHLVILDSTFIFTEKVSQYYPSTTFIYDMIDELKEYTKKYSVHETNYPILNISSLDSVRYLVKVALPINKDLPSFKNIESKRMPINVKILMAEVKGGSLTAANAFKQMQLYVSDHHLQMPGLPFFSLVTNRSKEPDTTQWLTRIYCPVR